MVKFFENVRFFFIGIIKILVFSKFKNTHKKIQRKFKDVIILGNGPSLKVELEKKEFCASLKKSDVVVVNYFNESNYFEEIQPLYYVLAAPEFWWASVPEWHLNNRTKLFNDLKNRVTWDMYLFIPFEARKNKYWLNIISSNQKITVIYYNNAAYDGSLAFQRFVFNSKLGQPRLHNIIGPSILNMIWAGYKKIYLTGVEHSWIPLLHVTKDNRALVGQPHFYDSGVQAEEMNGPNGSRKLHEILHKFYVTFKGYFEIRKFADAKGIEIVNLTENSFIDAFPKENVDIFITSKNNE